MVTAGSTVAEEACRAWLALRSSENTVGSDVARLTGVRCSVDIILFDVVAVGAQHLPFCLEAAGVSVTALFRCFASAWTVRIHRTLDLLPSCLLAAVVATFASLHNS